MLCQESWNVFNLFNIKFEAPENFFNEFNDEIQETVYECIQNLTYRCLEKNSSEDDNND